MCSRDVNLMSMLLNLFNVKTIYDTRLKFIYFSFIVYV